MAPPNPAADIETLSTRFPIALLPVRIETRFANVPPSLRVRIYPDEIFADAHLPDLTAAERADGIAFWTEAWAPANELPAWTKLVARYTAPRAAWIAKRCTPSNIASRPATSPLFPAVDVRDKQFPNAKTEALPSAWVVIAYRRGVEVARAVSSVIESPLQLAFRPDLDKDDPSIERFDELALERDLAWTIDFGLATQFGMAVTVPLTVDDLQLGFDRMVVFGVRAPFDPLEGAKLLHHLLDGHHYTRGLALVRQGTPTNNTGAAPAGYPPPSAGSYSFPIERGAALAMPGGDGSRIALALGVPPTTFDHVEGADRREDDNAKAMARALWPCTLGYFLEHIAAVATPSQIAEVRAHVGDFVRGRGPFAAFRIGRVPYGLLPVTSLSRWQAAPTSTIDIQLASMVEAWRRITLALSNRVARVGATGDADGDLLGALALDASAREVRLREAVGPAYLGTMFKLLGYSAGAEAVARTHLLRGLARPLALQDAPFRFGDLTFRSAAPRLDRALAANEPLSETATLADNYITWIRGASIAELRAAGVKDSPTFGNPLLFHLLRQASLVEYGRVALDLSVRHGAATDADRIEVELHRIAPGTETRMTPWTRFASPLAAVTGAVALGDWLLEPSSDADRLPVREYQEALDVLASLPSAELDRLTAETLDVCAYRVDAWITSLASRKLAAMRSSDATGIHLGACAWVEDLRPHLGPPASAAGGFVHAPSPSHAAAAAILRSGYLTRTGTEREQVAINLTSRRVRTALDLIDGVREGQPLAALLGYRFERALHAVALDKYIYPFRAKFPLGVDPGTPPSASTERIPARSVVDGLALRSALGGATAPAQIEWSSFPSEIAAPDRPGVASCLVQLDADVDATADLVLAESIYQTVQGNTDRASATLASLAGGGVLPEPQIVQVPARATTFTHRAAVLLGAPAGLAPGWNGTAPRAQASARLDAWVAARLADPRRVRCTASHASDPAHPDDRIEITIALADLDVCALDVIEIARRSAPDGAGELAARIAWHAEHGLGITQPIAIAYEPSPGTSFLDVLEVARRIGDMLAGARALLPVDLTRDATGATAGDIGELQTRADHARPRLQSARDAVATAAPPAADGTPAAIATLRAALWSLAAFGVRAAVAASAGDPETVAALIARAGAAVAEADRRLAAIADVAGDPRAQLAAMFGPELLVLPTFAAGNRAEVLDAIAAAPGLIGADVFAARRWFEGAARVRAPLARARLAAVATEALDGATIDFIATQLPLQTRWIGLDVDPAPNAPRPLSGTLSLVLHVELETAAPTWAGLVLDEWTEAIPAPTQATAFAVNYDAPGAEAPQCVVLAVPPGTATRWDLDTLTAIVNETADLARIRAVDPDLLGDYGQFVPATYIAANLADDTIGLDFAHHCMAETVILEAE